MVLCNIGWSTVDDTKKWKTTYYRLWHHAKLQKGPSKIQILKGLKLAQQDKVCKWSIATRSKGKPVSGFMATEKARRFYDGIK